LFFLALSLVLMNLSEFESGLYVLRIEWEGGAITELLNLSR